MVTWSVPVSETAPKQQVEQPAAHRDPFVFAGTDEISWFGTYQVETTSSTSFID